MSGAQLGNRECKAPTVHVRLNEPPDGVVHRHAAAAAVDAHGLRANELQLLRLAHDVDHILVGEVKQRPGPFASSIVLSILLRGSIVLVFHCSIVVLKLSILLRFDSCGSKRR